MVTGDGARVSLRESLQVVGRMVIGLSVAFFAIKPSFRNYPFGHTLAARRVVLVRVLVVGLDSPAVAPSAPARLFCCFCTISVLRLKP